ncbi:hypothetical protein DESPIG_01938 [Desulfovibrio piger ATCC 29098]|uniref:Uncharacterized protein n=1 Tax=Desulfovibrio piger ATCC 29098 TaxID=411464 RepID=B6WV23_9BACT|nr:hypothetical protein DESPIG_01938 [Desulfovibrio piger ATCC 29098]
MGDKSWYRQPEEQGANAIPAGEESLAGGGDTEDGNANARPERKRSRGVQTVDTLRQPQRATTGRML